MRDELDLPMWRLCEDCVKKYIYSFGGLPPYRSTPCRLPPGRSIPYSILLVGQSFLFVLPTLRLPTVGWPTTSSCVLDCLQLGTTMCQYVLTAGIPKVRYTLRVSYRSVFLLLGLLTLGPRHGGQPMLRVSRKLIYFFFAYCLLIV